MTCFYTGKGLAVLAGVVSGHRRLSSATRSRSRAWVRWRDARRSSPTGNGAAHRSVALRAHEVGDGRRHVVLRADDGGLGRGGDAPGGQHPLVVRQHAVHGELAGRHLAGGVGVVGDRHSPATIRGGRPAAAAASPSRAIRLPTAPALAIHVMLPPASSPALASDLGASAATSTRSAGPGRPGRSAATPRR